MHGDFDAIKPEFRNGEVDLAEVTAQVATKESRFREVGIGQLSRCYPSTGCVLSNRPKFGTGEEPNRRRHGRE